MPTAYNYTRVSHANSRASGLSPEAQRDVCRQYYEVRGLKQQGVQWYDRESIYDPAVSARHVPFLERKMGAKLHAMLQPGDHVIFAHMDRGFRAVLDWAALIEVWKSKQITVHIADMGVDLSTGPGMLVANIMVSVAQAHSDMLSERNKEIAATLRKLNRPTNGTKKLGYVAVGPKGNRRWTADQQERAIMTYIEYHRDVKGLSWERIADAVNRKICRWQKKPFKKSAFAKIPWNWQKCYRAYQAWKRIKVEESPDAGQEETSQSKTVQVDAEPPARSEF